MEITSVEVLKAYINRIQEVEPIINAVVCDRFDEALKEARYIDKVLDSGNVPAYYSREKAPFLGVPFTTKEAFAHKGMTNTSGLVSRKNMLCTKDAAVVARMKEAGAIPIAVTNCSELCMWYESSNFIYGRSNNPYDARRIVGGSSGGEGALHAASGTPIGIGSDIGGSIRMPCFFNGIFGHKPSSGIIPNFGQFPMATGKRNDFLSTGPMCRFAEDLEPMFRVLAGEEGLSKLKMDTTVDLKSLRYFTIVDDGDAGYCSRVSQELRDAQAKAAKYIEESLNVPVVKTMVHRLRLSLPIWSAMMSKHGEVSFTDLMTDGGPQVYPAWELLKWVFQLSNHTLPAIGLGIVEKFDEMMMSKDLQERLCKASDKLRRDFEELLGSDGVLLYPSHPKVAPYHNSPLFTPMNFAYTGIFNMMGFPVTQVPLGLNADGVPLGVQVIALTHNDHLTMAVARKLEEAFGGWKEPV
uniref:Fatty-acid amide hydrolase 2-A-like n=1 Tax=Saccoglossus kowalevskii TaxID=10224 RepID=A0ABM0GPI0_SACKO|nr:PREDICTED: fatty-acid amide hydrolase 2-A-like [Saccoglossus kowalevskii]